MEENDVRKVEINVHGSQINIAKDNASINATVNRHDKINNKKKKYVKKMALLITFILLLFNIFISYVSKVIKYKDVSSKINKITLSMDRSYLDELLGQPISVIDHSESKFIECLYQLDGVVVRIFSLNSTCCAYFVTLTEENKFLTIETDNLFFPNKKNLGDFTYYDVPETPTYILGYAQNGTGNILYSEFYAGYKLRTHALMYMKYGTDFGYIIIPGEVIYDEKVTEDFIPFWNLFWPVDGTDELAKRTYLNMEVDRKVARPNTFGVMDYFYLNIIEYITDYNSIDYSLWNSL